MHHSHLLRVIQCYAAGLLKSFGYGVKVVRVELGVLRGCATQVAGHVGADANFPVGKWRL